MQYHMDRCMRPFQPFQKHACDTISPCIRPAMPPPDRPYVVDVQQHYTKNKLGISYHQKKHNIQGQDGIL
jgi:hypothetical protein